MSNRELARELHSQLNPSQFEDFLSILLKEMGFSEVEVTGRAGDRGIDLKGTWTEENIPGFQVDLAFKIQAKRHTPSTTLNPRYVRELRGTLTSGEWGLIITTGRVTSNTRQEGLSEASRMVSIIDGEDLIDLCIKYGVGIKTDYHIDLSVLATEEVSPAPPEEEPINTLDILNRSLQEEFSQLGSSTIYKSRTKWVIARTSKRYERSDMNYWYGTKTFDLDRVKKYNITHFAFICSNRGVVLLPKEEMLSKIIKDSLSKSVTKEGKIRHYHIQFYEREGSLYWRLKTTDQLIDQYFHSIR